MRSVVRFVARHTLLYSRGVLCRGAVRSVVLNCIHVMYLAVVCAISYIVWCMPVVCLRCIRMSHCCVFCVFRVSTVLSHMSEYCILSSIIFHMILSCVYAVLTQLVYSM